MTPQEAWEARGNLYDKYNDPNWMLQAGLGDIEFEQDMYDDIRYGGISEEGAKFGDVLGFSEDPYDVTGLAGLREHATKGPTRYLDFTPFDLPSEKFDTDKFGYDIGEGGYEDYLGRYNVREDALGEGTGETTNIDINLPKHIGWWDRTGRGGGHALQNIISDTYRHEYKHSPKLTSHRNPYHHQAIYGQGAKYGLSPVSREQSFQKFMDPPAENFSTVHYNPSRAAETSRDISSFASNPFERSFEQPTNRAVSRQPARGPHDYKKGGSVNPHEETARAARDWSPREQYISRSNQDRTQDASINRFIREGQGNQQRWEQGGGQGAYPVVNEPGGSYNAPLSPGWLQAKTDSGINLLEKGKNIYDKFKPYIPEVRDDMLNWNIDTDYGNFGFGIGEGKGGLNWSLPFHKASTTVGTGSLRKGIETLKDKFRWGLSEEEKQYLDTPLREPGGIGFGGEIVDKFRTNNPEATIQDLYNYLEEQGRSFQPGDMLDPGDWYNWGENEMEYSI